MDERDCARCGQCSPLGETCLFCPFVAGWFCSLCFAQNNPERGDLWADVADLVSARNSWACCCILALAHNKDAGLALRTATCCCGPPLCLLASTLCGPCVLCVASSDQAERNERRQRERANAAEAALVAAQVQFWEQALQTAEADRPALRRVVQLGRGATLEPPVLDPRAPLWACRVAATGPQASQEATQQTLAALAVNKAWREPELPREDARLLRELLRAPGPEAAAATDVALCRALVRRVAAGTADGSDREAAALLSSDKAVAEALSCAEGSLLACLRTDGPEAQAAAACRALLRLAAAFRGGIPDSAFTEALIRLANSAGPGVRGVAAVVLREMCPSFSSASAVARTLAALWAELPSFRPEPALGLRCEAWEEEAHRCIPFWFVRADKIRAWQDTDPPLPRFQQLKQWEGWMETLPMSAHACFQGFYQQRVLAVSHRWEQPGQPDPSSTQLKVLRGFLREHLDVEYVWMDWYCMPQGNDRTDEEKAYFRLALTNINLLYLGLTVLAIYDYQYVSRFWCVFEAWCAMRRTSAEGLGRPPPEERRIHVRCTGAAAEQAVMHVALLFQAWENKSAAQLSAKLRMDDIMVTNQGDKDTQLQKLTSIEEFVKKSCKAGLTLDLSGDDNELLPLFQADDKAWSVRVPNDQGGSQLEPPEAQRMQPSHPAVQQPRGSRVPDPKLIGRGNSI